MSILQLSGSLVLLCGVGLVLVGLSRYRKKRALFAAARSIEGKVIGLIDSGTSVFVSEAAEGHAAFREEDNLHSGVSLAPKIEFTDPYGKVCTIRGKVASSPPRYAIGDSVRLLCPPGSPEKAIVDRFAEKWLLETFLFGVGLTLLAIGLLFLALSAAEVGN